MIRIAWGAAALVAAVILHSACSSPAEPASPTGHPFAAVRRGLDPDLTHGADLYDRHCALCHGVWGAGDGMASSVLHPPARDFAVGAFGLASTTNGMPSEDDFVATLRRGMPGSAMPSWDWMPESDLRMLAGYVRHLAVRGLARRLEDDRGNGEPPKMTEREALRMAHDLLTPGDRVTVVTAAPADAPNLARGRDVFIAHCADCHGTDAKGKEVPAVWSGGAQTTRTRDLTAGALKGDATDADLCARILAGMPASGMPPTQLEPDDLATLLAYLRTILPADAGKRHVQRRQTLCVGRTTQPVPTDANDARWDTATAIDVALSPLWWTELAIPAAQITALHDGRTLAVRIRWNDATRDDSPLGDLRFRDGCALQVSTGSAPRLFGMGAENDPVEIWHWRSVRFRDVAGLLDLIERPPHGQPGAYPWDYGPLPVYRPSLRKDRIGSAETLSASGFERLGAELAGGSIESHASWDDGVWSLVVVRSFQPRNSREFQLTPGATLQIGCAIWNGAAHDHRAHKSITIWHGLELAR